MSPDLPFQDLKDLLATVIVPYSQQIPWTVAAVSPIPSGKAAGTLTDVPTTLPWWTPKMSLLMSAMPNDRPVATEDLSETLEIPVHELDAVAAELNAHGFLIARDLPDGAIGWELRPDPLP